MHAAFPAALCIPHSWESRTDAALLQDCALLVNTTELGMQGKQPLDMPLTTLPPHAVVSDIVYAPLETPLLQAAAARGLHTSDGLGMLLYQAQAAFRLWFGVEPQVTPELRAKVVASFSSQ
jgi:shikimate dehydrogenase